MNKEIKKFKKRTLILLIIEFIVMSSCMIGVILIVMLPKIRTLENEYVEENLNRLRTSIELRLENIEQTAIDWSVWDDTYYFMKDMNDGYIDSNISYSTLVNLRLDILIYYDSKGSVKFGTQIDPDFEELKSVDVDIINYINEQELFRTNRDRKGLIDIKDTPFMIVSYPITLNDGSGDIVGNLIIGRYLNDQLVQEISEELGVVTYIDKYSNGLNVNHDFTTTNPLSKEQIQGSTLITDINNEPYLWLKMEMPRTAMKIGREALLGVIFSVFIMYILFTSLIFYYFDQKILIEMNDYKIQLSSSEAKLAKINERLEKSVYEKTRRLKAIVKAIPDVIFKLDKNGTFIDSEIKDVDWLLFKEEEFIGKNLKDIMPPDIAEIGLEKLQEAISTKKITIQEYELLMDGVKNYFEVRFISTNQEDVFAILRNVNEINEKKRYIEYLSYHDQLTKIHNRRYYEEEILRLDCKEKLPLSVAMIDVNGLKLINDIFGHNKGDILIQKIANILDHHTREGDLLARIGGDEFLYAFPRTNYDEAKNIINNVQKTVKESTLENINMSISIGCDTKVDEKEDLYELIVSAENKMYKKKLIESQLMRKKTVEGILTSIYEEREIDKEHSIRVKDYCMLIGKELHYSEDMLEELEKSALLHDIGKVSVDEKLLDLPRRLSESEFELVKKHAANGYQLLKAVDSYASIAENVLSHHEYWDGHGYPRKLIGEQIPELARIIAIAEAYESMTAFRSYQDKLTKEQAIHELLICAGTQFDPSIVDIFIHKCI